MRLANNFRDLLTLLNHDVMYEVMDNLNIADLISLRTSSICSDKLVAGYLASKYNTLLAHFFNDVPTFRGLMRHSHCVISGSCALAFVLPAQTSWSPTDLDLYVPNGEFIHVVAYLEVFEGYTEVSPRPAHAHYTAAIERVVRLQKGSKVIDIIQSAGISALQPLALFWLTATVNYLSADFVYVAYPQLTMAGHALIHPLYTFGYNTLARRTLPLLQKYRQRGFRICIRNSSWSHDSPQQNQTTRIPNAACTATVRFFGDEYGLTTSLHPADIDVTDVIQQQRVTVVWRRGGLPCGMGCAATAADANALAEEVAIDV